MCAEYRLAAGAPRSLASGTPRACARVEVGVGRAAKPPPLLRTIPLALLTLTRGNFGVIRLRRQPGVRQHAHCRENRKRTDREEPCLADPRLDENPVRGGQVADLLRALSSHVRVIGDDDRCSAGSDVRPGPAVPVRDGHAQGVFRPRL